MVTKMSAPGRSFKGVADYCLHDRWVPGQGHPESAERVEWTETRNVATDQGDRAARIMAATAEASPELKRLAGGAATGRKLEKPVCHYSLNWAKDEKPDRQEMLRAAERSLKALGMERHQALIVSHRDGQPHVHVIANRVEPESGKAAGLSRSKLRLSKWAERYEREQGKIRCPQRERNNARRGQGKRVQDRVSRPTGRPGTGGAARSGSGWPGSGQRSAHTGSSFRGGGARRSGNWRNGASGSGRRFTGVTSGSGSSWRKTAVGCWGASGLGGSWAAECERSAGRSGDERKCWDASGRSWRTGYAGSGFRWEKSIPKRCGESRARRENFTAVAWKGRRNGRGRRRGRTGSYWILTVGLTNFTDSSTRCWRSDWSRCGEIDGEQAYEKMRRAVEKASQEKARQVEMARQVERSSKLPARKKPERDYGPSR